MCDTWSSSILILPLLSPLAEIGDGLRGAWLLRGVRERLARTCAYLDTDHLAAYMCAREGIGKLKPFYFPACGSAALLMDVQ